MTPLETCYAIKGFLKEHLKEMRLPTPDGTESAIHFYQMALPQPGAQTMNPRPEDEDGNELPRKKPTADDEPIEEGSYTPREARKIFPAIVITPTSGTGGEWSDPWSTVSILLTVGVFEDSNASCEGVEWLMTITTKIRQLFERYRTLESKFQIERSPSWNLVREVVRPFWFVEIETEWRIPLLSEEIDLTGDYRGANYPSGDALYPN